MSARFEILDSRPTPLGEISLRRRLEPALQVDVYEAKLGDEFLMSSLFTASEVALAQRALAELPDTGLDVLVGGLGLGYTARAVLDDRRVRSLHVVEALDEVIDWHHRGLLPLSDGLVSDRRCRLVHGDFFALVTGAPDPAPDRHDVDVPAAPDGPNLPAAPDVPVAPDVPAPVDAVLVDIDHSPRHLLHPDHAALYRPAGLRRVADRLRPGGVFTLWSDDPPDDGFTAAAGQVFRHCTPQVVAFPNPHTGGESTSTVYVARKA